MKVKRIIIGSIVSVAVAASTIAITFESKRTSFLKISPDDSDVISIDVSGAVLFKGKHYFKKGVKLREILSVVKEKNADLTKINLDKEYKSSEKLFVPFLNNDTDVSNSNKLNWFELNTENQLKKFGISKNVAKQLLELRKNKLKIGWDDIRNLKGIGQKTFLKLKKVLIL
ncbi:hypothetical protein MBOVa_6780 [Mycoplasmopsis bovis 8790]|nr:hypothetical protein MBOVa_6780 [Mycoplasmopsis bovis 8790]